MAGIEIKGESQLPDLLTDSGVEITTGPRSVFFDPGQYLLQAFVNWPIWLVQNLRLVFLLFGCWPDGKLKFALISTPADSQKIRLQVNTLHIKYPASYLWTPRLKSLNSTPAWEQPQ